MVKIIHNFILTLDFCFIFEILLKYGINNRSIHLVLVRAMLMDTNKDGRQFKLVDV